MTISSGTCTPLTTVVGGGGGRGGGVFSRVMEPCGTSRALSVFVLQALLRGTLETAGLWRATSATTTSTTM